MSDVFLSGTRPPPGEQLLVLVLVDAAGEANVKIDPKVLTMPLAQALERFECALEALNLYIADRHGLTR